MANNPLYDDSLKHWLNFKSPNYGRVQIAEPINFDSFSFKISQAKDRFGRDKEIGGEEIDLEFSDIYTEKLDKPQTLIDGTVIYELSHRLDLIFEALKEKGSECEIEYVLTRNNTEVVLGLLDIPESTTDGFSSFKCSVIQNTNKALIERKKDIKADVFSETDTFGNYQKPLDKVKVLLKAKPVTQVSEWGVSVDEFSTFAGFYEPTIWNNLQNIEKYGIEDTLTFIDVAISGDDSTPYIKQVGNIIQAKNELTNIRIQYNFKTKYTGFVETPEVSYDSMQFAIKVFKTDFESTDWLSKLNSAELLYVSPLIRNEDTDELNLNLEYTMQGLSVGENLYIVGQTLSVGPDGSFRGVHFDDFGSSITITATSTAVSSVIDAVPYFDFLEQGVKSISGLELDAYDIKEGEFTDQYVFNGSMMRQRDSVPLNFVFKDEMNDLKEVNMDYQIQDDKVILYQYPDFYTLTDLGAFLQVPNLKFERKFNDRFKKVSLNYGYKTYEQDKDQFNTIDSFQTEAQFLFPTKQVDDELKVDINHIRDAFTIEPARREAISETTALGTDDKIFIVDCVEIPENYTESITRTLRMRLNDGLLLEILSDNFNWTLLGFKNGDTVYITSGENIGEYAVLQHGVSLLELVFIGSGDEPEFSGISLITLEYPLTNVSLMNRTNEGFNLIENIENPNEVSNLKYSIKRNLSRFAWSSYLATICKDNLDGVIKCTDFKVNGNLTTRFEFGQILKENEDIPVSDLSEKILNKYVYKTTVMASFEDAKKLIEDIVLLRGFIRIYDTQNRVIKVHPQTIDMNWALGEMEIVGEARNESDFIVITSNDQGISIFDVGYESVIDRNLDWFKIDGNYVQIFDNEQKPLINPTNFQKISVNGEFFQDKELFYIKLDNL